MRLADCEGVRVGVAEAAALGVRPVVTDCVGDGETVAEVDVEGESEPVGVGEGDGGGAVGHALFAPRLSWSDGRLRRVHAVGLAHDPCVPAGKVTTAETPPAEIVLCQPAAPSRQTVPSGPAVPVEVIASGPTATTRDPGQGLPPSVTVETMQVRRGLRSGGRRSNASGRRGEQQGPLDNEPAFHHPAAMAAMSAPVWSRRPLGTMATGFVHFPLVRLYEYLQSHQGVMVGKQSATLSARTELHHSLVRDTHQLSGSDCKSAVKFIGSNEKDGEKPGGKGNGVPVDGSTREM